MPKVSVIVPVYNVEPYLRECMESLVRQTLKDIEIICVNDGSTDGSPAILKEYAARDSRIVLVDKENGGYGLAMNIGLDRAAGEYVGIVEPDDFAALTMYEDLYNAAKENDLDLVKADFKRFYTEGDRETYIRTRLSREDADYGIVFKPAEKPDCFFWVMNTWSGIYRLSFLREKGIRHNETPGAAFQDNGFRFQTLGQSEQLGAEPGEGVCRKHRIRLDPRADYAGSRDVGKAEGRLLAQTAPQLLRDAAPDCAGIP